MRYKIAMVAVAVAAMAAAMVATNRPTKAEDKVEVDSAIAKYEAVAGVSGNISSVGSDTCNNLMTLWAEG
ncbi:MAG: phosphate-binding protein, partial [Planctomycetes bacterium]|nr:phosphate-binding protein [Planctomycetota bacterium]